MLQVEPTPEDIALLNNPETPYSCLEELMERGVYVPPELFVNKPDFQEACRETERNRGMRIYPRDFNGVSGRELLVIEQFIEETRGKAPDARSYGYPVHCVLAAAGMPFDAEFVPPDESPEAYERCWSAPLVDSRSPAEKMRVLLRPDDRRRTMQLTFDFWKGPETDERSLFRYVHPLHNVLTALSGDEFWLPVQESFQIGRLLRLTLYDRQAAAGTSIDSECQRRWELLEREQRHGLSRDELVERLAKEFSKLNPAIVQGLLVERMAASFDTHVDMRKITDITQSDGVGALHLPALRTREGNGTTYAFKIDHDYRRFLKGVHALRLAERVPQVRPYVPQVIGEPFSYRGHHAVLLEYCQQKRAPHDDEKRAAFMELADALQTPARRLWADIGMHRMYVVALVNTYMRPFVNDPAILQHTEPSIRPFGALRDRAFHQNNGNHARYRTWFDAQEERYARSSEQLAAVCGPTAFCHGDTNPNNWIGPFLFDFEYASRGVPLADAARAACFQPGVHAGKTLFPVQDYLRAHGFFWQRNERRNGTAGFEFDQGRFRFQALYQALVDNLRMGAAFSERGIPFDGFAARGDALARLVDQYSDGRTLT
jgi:hypothetical protein